MTDARSQGDDMAADFLRKFPASNIDRSTLGAWFHTAFGIGADIYIASQPPGVGPALSALIEQWRQRVAVCRRIAGEVSDQCALAQAWVEEADHVERCADELEAALSGSVGGLNAAPPERQDDLGLSIDMLDVDRLRDWANLLLIHGPDISYWGSLHFVTSKMQIMATEMEKAIRDIGVLRALPASPVCAAEKKTEKG